MTMAKRAITKRVFIAVGHGGSDPGAIAFGYKESVLALTTSLKCRDVLQYHGVIVGMSRVKEEDDPLADEIRECNAFKPDLSLTIHVNAGKGDGFEVFYSKVGGVGKELAIKIEQEVKAIGQNSRGIKTKLNQNGSDYFGYIRQTNCPAVICEGFFIDNKNDLKDFDEKHELEGLGVAYAKAVLRQLGIAYKGEGNVKPPQTSTPSKPSTKPLWELCINGAEVKKIQTELNKNYKAKLKVDGWFGDSTLAACPLVKSGKNFLIKILQERLKAKGEKLPKYGADGSFGAETIAAVKSFQKKKGLAVDGIVGNNTWKALYLK